MRSLHDLLVALGLDDVELQEVATVDWLTDDVGHGLLAGPATRPAGGLSYPIGVLPSMIGGTLDRVPGRSRTLGFTVMKPATVDDVVLFPGGSAALVSRSPHRVELDLAQTDGAVLRLGRKIVVITSAGGILRGVDFRVTPSADVPPFPREALEEIGDAWLETEVSFHLDVADAWHHAVAAGVFLRLRDVPKDGRLPVFARDSWPHRWMAGLSAEQRRVILSRAEARLDSLWAELEDLSSDSKIAHSEFDRDAFVRVSTARDEFEGVRTLLAWCDASGNLETRLRGFDAVAEQAIRSLPPTVDVTDERLIRAAVASPIAWWTSRVRLT